MSVGRKTKRMLLAEAEITMEPLETYLLRRLNRGDSYKDIAGDLHITSGGLSYWIAKLGITTRYDLMHEDENERP